MGSVGSFMVKFTTSKTATHDSNGIILLSVCHVLDTEVDGEEQARLLHSRGSFKIVWKGKTRPNWLNNFSVGDLKNGGVPFGDLSFMGSILGFGVVARKDVLWVLLSTHIPFTSVHVVFVLQPIQFVVNLLVGGVVPLEKGQSSFFDSTQQVHGSLRKRATMRPWWS